MHARQFQARFAQPLLKIGDRRRILVVQVRPRGDQLDRLKPVRRNFEQVLAP